MNQCNYHSPQMNWEEALISVISDFSFEFLSNYLLCRNNVNECCSVYLFVFLNVIKYCSRQFSFATYINDCYPANFTYISKLLLNEGDYY